MWFPSLPSIKSMNEWLWLLQSNGDELDSDVTSSDSKKQTWSWFILQQPHCVSPPGIAMAYVSVVALKTHHQHFELGWGRGVPNIGSSWASFMSWYDVSRYLCVTSKSFFYPHKETVSSLRSWTAVFCPLVLRFISILSLFYIVSHKATALKYISQEQICRAWNVCSLGTLLHKNSSKL